MYKSNHAIGKLIQSLLLVGIQFTRCLILLLLVPEENANMNELQYLS